MAKKLASDVRVYFGGYDPGTATTRISVNLESKVLDPTVIVDVAERATAGERADGLEWAGLFDDGVSMDVAQAVLLGSGTAVWSVLVGTASGDVAYSGTVFSLSAKAPAKIGDLVRYEVTIKPDQKLDRAKYLGLISKTGTADANSGWLDNAGSSTAGGVIYAHIFPVTGTFQWQYQHSIDQSTIDTLIGWQTNLTSTGTIIALTGTIRRYVRAASTGTSTTGTLIPILIRN